MSSIQIILGDAFDLLCIRLIEKNIVANLKKHFRNNEGWERFLADWHLLVASIDVETFIANWKDLHIFYCKYGQTVEYLRSTWIVKKEKFVTAFTKLVFHLGHFATSRSEGKHSSIKGWISVSS